MKFLVAVNSMSVFSSIGWRRGGGMFWRYASGARPASSGASSEEAGLPGAYRLIEGLTSIGDEVSTHVSRWLGAADSVSDGEFLRLGAYVTYSS